jgi:hypothetical protein
VLRSLLNLMKRYPRYEYDLRSIFWHIATTDVTTFSVLDELLHTSNPDDAALLARSLAEAPKGLAVKYPMFAVHLLTECAGRSEELERAAMTRLIGNCFSASGFQAVPVGVAVTLGGAEPSDAMKTSVAALLANCQPGSLAFRLYTEIANARRPLFASPTLPDMLGDAEDFEEE